MIKKSLIFMLAIVCLSAVASRAEEVKITTYYPSPYGVYKGLSSTSDTNLATDATAKVGIGTATPVSKLDIAGGNLNIPATTSSQVGVICQSGQSFINSYGAGNLFIGKNAGNFSMTGSGENIGIGVGTLSSNVSGFFNTAIGWGVLGNNTSGSSNTGIGWGTLSSNNTGFNNTATGMHALAANASGSNNTADGFYALSSNTGSDNTATGAQALYVNNTGSGNTATGAQALVSNTGGNYNTAFGGNALASVLFGGQNTAVGYNALHDNIGGSNIAVGAETLRANANGNNNIAVGNFALAFPTADSNNTAVGDGALSAMIGSDNAALGKSAGYLGMYTGATYSGATFIGAYAEAGGPGSLTNATAIGYKAAVSTSNSLVLGGVTGVNGGTSVKVGIGTTAPLYTLHVVGTAGLSTGTAWTFASDIRLKDVHGDYEYGLNEVLKLHTVRFNYKKGNPLNLPSDKPMTGFIAQEVQKVIPDAIHENKNGYLELNADPIHWAMVNAIQEQQKQIKDLKTGVEEQQKEIEELKKEITELNKKS